MVRVGFSPSFLLSLQVVNFQRISNYGSLDCFPRAYLPKTFPHPPYSTILTCQGLQELVTAALIPDQQIVGGFGVLKLHSQALVAESHFQMGNIRQVVRLILLQPVCRLSPNHRAQPSAAAGCWLSHIRLHRGWGGCQKSLCMSPHLQGKASAGWHYPALTALLQGFTCHHSAHLIAPVTSST